MLKLFKNFKKREWLLMCVSLVFIVTQVWLDLKMPDYMAEITTLVQTPESTMTEILTAGAKMLICALGSLVAAAVTVVCTARIASTFGGTLRERMFRKVQSFSMEEIGHFSTASLITRSTNDITQIQMLIAMGLQLLIKAPVMAVWAICKIADKQWQWTLSTGIAVVNRRLYEEAPALYGLFAGAESKRPHSPYRFFQPRKAGNSGEVSELVGCF